MLILLVDNSVTMDIVFLAVILIVSIDLTINFTKTWKKVYNALLLTNEGSSIAGSLALLSVFSTSNRNSASIISPSESSPNRVASRSILKSPSPKGFIDDADKFEDGEKVAKLLPIFGSKNNLKAEEKVAESAPLMKEDDPAIILEAEEGKVDELPLPKINVDAVIKIEAEEKAAKERAEKLKREKIFRRAKLQTLFKLTGIGQIITNILFCILVIINFVLLFNDFDVDPSTILVIRLLYKNLLALNTLFAITSISKPRHINENEEMQKNIIMNNLLKDLIYNEIKNRRNKLAEKAITNLNRKGSLKNKEEITKLLKSRKKVPTVFHQYKITNESLMEMNKAGVLNKHEISKESSLSNDDDNITHLEKVDNKNNTLTPLQAVNNNTKKANGNSPKYALFHPGNI